MRWPLELAAAAYDVGSQLGFTLASGAGYFGAYMRDDHVHAYVSQNVQAVARTADLEPVETRCKTSPSFLRRTRASTTSQPRCR